MKRFLTFMIETTKASGNLNVLKEERQKYRKKTHVHSKNIFYDIQCSLRKKANIPKKKRKNFL